MRSILVHQENGKFSIFHSKFSIRRRQRRSRSGFTLIEMLVVIVIIVILMGVVFRLTRGAMAKSDYAKEEALVTKVRTLIEEFHAEYNIYPPVPTYLTHDGVYRQPINFRGDCPDGERSRQELLHYPPNFSYAKINGKDCYFIFGLFSFFVDRSKYGQTAFEVNGDHGEAEVGEQWGAQNDSVGGIGGKITISQKDKAFAHRVWPIVAELCGEGGGFDDPPLHQDYEIQRGWCKGFTTSVYGQWAADAGGIGKREVDGKILKTYEEGLVYISKPPYTTYLLFSKGPDNAYDEDHPEDRTRPKNKDNIYGNLGDK